MCCASTQLLLPDEMGAWPHMAEQLDVHPWLLEDVYEGSQGSLC